MGSSLTLGEAYNNAVAAFGAAGCRYLQLDEVNIAYLCDPEQIAGLKARGEHVENLLSVYAGMLNRAIEAKPAGMAISMHLCRGNFRRIGWRRVAMSRWPRRFSTRSTPMRISWSTIASGRGGSSRFASCRGDTRWWCWGWSPARQGRLRAKDELKRRIDEAAKYLPLEQLALSPQCGFASTEEGNTLTEDEQWAKLRLCVEVAREVWGGV